jgi:DNA-binding NarL/FixJ family response regulator
VADDHTLLRDGLVALLNGSGECTVVAGSAGRHQRAGRGRAHAPDVAVIDISMPKLNGMEVVRRLTQELPATRVLVLTMHAEEEYVLHVVRAGAAGFLLKDSASSELLAAVKNLHAGRGYFGPHAAHVLAQAGAQAEGRRWTIPTARSRRASARCST